ncbi:protein 5NUC-like [Drosophila busckii]|uniref:protein 5NUC-like n=1 Tax=Drosophila busckii TaxID=30019 RepID=UPI00083F466E|nr:protein 5NUC-like [Drosophila busckii]
MTATWQLLVIPLLLYLGPSVANPIAPVTKFIILHNNDMHARFEQTNINGGSCSKEQAEQNKCYGGFARVAHEVRRHREEAKNGGTAVLYLNAGDTYTGTNWFAVFKDKMVSAFLNKLQPDASSLGNHEFDESVQGLIPFLNAVNFPVLACNLDLSLEPELAATHLSNSTILQVNGAKIGIIGYLTPKTKEDTFSNVVFEEEIIAINAEAARLKAKGINIIIALGHSGYLKDQQIAKNCPEVDLVIGGHSHTYLESNKPIAAFDDTASEANRGPFPTVVEQPSGKKVPVVQAFAYTKYLGKLHVQFDVEGNLVECDGAPLALNATIAQDQDILDLLEIYRPNVTAHGQRIVGHSKVFLEGGGVCRLRECNLGNVIADSMVYARMKENKSMEYWTDAAVALIQGGGIRTSVLRNSADSINFGDIVDIMPFKLRLLVTRITGKTLLNILEHSAAVRTTDSKGGFLQFSGLQVVYDFGRAAGNRVVSVLVRCAECIAPSYSPLNTTAEYNIVVTDFLLRGGDGFVFSETPTETYTEFLQKGDQAALEQYFQDHNFVYPGIENRIIIRNSTTF